MRVLILCFLTILSSSAIDDNNLDHIVVVLESNSHFSEMNSSEDEVEELRPLLLENSVSDPMVGNVPILIDDVWPEIFQWCYAKSVVSLSKVSKRFYGELKKTFPRNVDFSAFVLSRYSSSLGILYVIQAIENCHQNLDFKTDGLLQFPRYLQELERLNDAKSLFDYSPLLWKSDGLKRVEDILLRHKLTLDTPKPHFLRRLWYSLGRDPAILGLGALTTLAIVGPVVWDLVRNIRNSLMADDIYALELSKHLQYTYSPAYLDRYVHSTGYTEYRTFSAYGGWTYGSHAPCITKYEDLSEECFDTTKYCASGHSNLANITDLAQRIWVDIRHNISSPAILENVSLGNIQSVFLDIFNKTCVEKLEIYKLGGTPLVYRIKENSSLLIRHFQSISGSVNCYHLGDSIWTVAESYTSLYHYDPLCIARAMTPLVSFGKTIIAESTSIALTIGFCAFLSWPMFIPLW